MDKKPYTPNRREFLRISSTAAVGLTIATITQRNLFAAPSETLSPLLSVGYARSLPVGDGARVALANANGVLTPDPTFLSRGVRVAVRGGCRADGYATKPGGLAVDALFPVNGKKSDKFPRFAFWCACGNKVSGLSSFTMPAVATSGISFLAQRLQAGDKSPNLDTSNLTLALSGAGPKLQRGVYVLAMAEAKTDRAPDWNRLELVRSNGRLVIPNAGVGYVILSIDYAESA